jgi:predicted nucleotidyltransferase component of viral defense system
MITKQEILKIASEMKLLPHVVEKDYILGWVLASINKHSLLGSNWIFKGGTCLKKCYFNQYRFSEDLDFTLKDEHFLNEKFLKEAFHQVAEWIYENCGIELLPDRATFEFYENKRGKINCEGRIYYRGPIAPAHQQRLPRIKLDLTADEIIVDTPILADVNHSYSDLPESGIKIQSYSYPELFAEKIRALIERTRPRDLYDIIYFYRKPESKDLVAKIKTILIKKCEFKNLSKSSYNELLLRREICLSGWNNELGHQMKHLPSFESFWDELPKFFHWLGY